MDFDLLLLYNGGSCKFTKHINKNPSKLWNLVLNMCSWTRQTLFLADVPIYISCLAMQKSTESIIYKFLTFIYYSTQLRGDLLNQPLFVEFHIVYYYNKIIF